MFCDADDDSTDGTGGIHGRRRVPPEGHTTVGTHMDSTHLAATPVGMEVRAEAKLLEVDGKKLVFSVEAYDEKDCIGKGVHTRFIVNSGRFMQRRQKSQYRASRYRCE